LGADDIENEAQAHGDGVSEYLIKEYRGDGYSLTSKTKSADQYLKS
jgi:hypothetical protein